MLELYGIDSFGGEQDYLERNPDVAAAVRQGSMPSGRYHYDTYGMNEGRLWDVPVTQATTKSYELPAKRVTTIQEDTRYTQNQIDTVNASRRRTTTPEQKSSNPFQLIMEQFGNINPMYIYAGAGTIILLIALKKFRKSKQPLISLPLPK